jgi:hypothetical protein
LGLISIVISLLAAVPTGYAEKGKHGTSQLWTFAATEVVPGGKSELFRSDDEICMNIHTKALREGAYTIWWFAFNSPEHCTSPVAVGGARCGSGDVGNTAVNASVLWATGGIVGPDGVGYFNACLNENKLPPPHKVKTSTALALDWRMLGVQKSTSGFVLTVRQSGRLHRRV